ncbi:MAG: DUF924 family protein, partial [Bacillota bacterium]
DDVLDFWFGSRDARGPARPEWFRRDEAFDAEIRRRFGALHSRAASGELDSWRANPESLLALVVVLDQFSRNLYRDDPRAFAQDDYARDCADGALARGDDLGLRPVERQFFYMPFEHSEDLQDQERAVDLMRSLEAFEETRGLTQWAERHRDVIRRFGRFPHRNRILGRASTPEETAFLEQPGSRF